MAGILVRQAAEMSPPTTHSPAGGPAGAAAARPAAAIHRNTNASPTPEVEWFLQSRSWVSTSFRRSRFVRESKEDGVDANRNELVTRLSVAAGIIMEDACPLAITEPPVGHVEDRLAVLERATRDANLLIRAAEVVAVRNIR
jgi:hypothetical protein